eukprot:2911261-Alexandrium_andersonii.AAC.1
MAGAAFPAQPHKQGPPAAATPGQPHCSANASLTSCKLARGRAQSACLRVEDGVVPKLGQRP